jgi:hypothetical protein
VQAGLSQERGCRIGALGFGPRDTTCCIFRFALVRAGRRSEARA